MAGRMLSGELVERSERRDPDRRPDLVSDLEGVVGLGAEALFSVDLSSAGDARHGVMARQRRYDMVVAGSIVMVVQVR